ncbi:HAD family hydrolase [Leeia aquatica]|nr:HAD family phosphatase [Leeia aquatica]
MAKWSDTEQDNLPHRVPHASMVSFSRPAARNDMIKAVVFDFGGVLFDWSPEYLYQTLIPDEAERRWFLQEVCNPAWNLQQDAGRSIAEAEAEKIAAFPQHETLIKAFYGQWPVMLKGALTDGVALLESLHAADIPLYGLTNWSAETYPYAEQHYPFLQRFRHVAVSGRLKLAKPDPAIYQHLLQHIGVAAEACVFIDDVLHNVEGARALGWHAIHHRSGPDTAAALRALGLSF